MCCRVRCRAQFEAFSDAWNAVRGSVTRFRCTEFRTPLPPMAGSQSLALCLVEVKDSGAYLCGMIETLVASQNAFLQHLKAALHALPHCPPHLWQLATFLAASPPTPLPVQTCRVSATIRVACEGCL